MKKLGFVALMLIIALQACRNGQEDHAADTPQAGEVKLIAPEFNSDTAFAYVKAQIDCGPRIPGTVAHQQCAEYLTHKLRSFGAEVKMQGEKTTTYDGKTFLLKNILASFAPEKKRRVLIAAHWDARPFSDRDTNPANRNKSFDAANDGGSGVAVILEMARQIQKKQPDVDVDFVLWDLEDFGDSSDENTWCLGSQFWARNAKASGYTALYGINLDMVGGGNPHFSADEVSRLSAPDVVRKVWGIANEIGYPSYFPDQKIGPLIDDRVWMNKAGIPSVDLIDHDGTDFYINHHTQLDNLAHIERNTLKAVGQTVLETIYREQ